jgi:Cdc6-like AAA superfamily ATPase
MSQGSSDQRQFEVDSVFTPGAPISRKDLFAGRKEQIARLLESLRSPGIHPVIYGQRGVGKTSLANILAEFLPEVACVKASCDSADTFAAIWRKVLRRVAYDMKQRVIGFAEIEAVQAGDFSDFLGQDRSVTPSCVADLLGQITASFVVILDEFDRLSDAKAVSATADLLKNLSDNYGHITVAIVGVGQSISELVGQHESIIRNLRQIEVPQMEPQEIRDIVVPRCGRLGISMDSGVLEDIITLADGFPHYAHLLGRSAARVAIKNGLKRIDQSVFQRAAEAAVEDASETLKDAFATATTTSKPSSYAKILIACGYAQHNERGVFRATDVRDAVLAVFKEETSVPAVVPALGAFTSAERGPVLDTVPVSGRNQYKFRDPLMRPYLKIRGRAAQAR